MQNHAHTPVLADLGAVGVDCETRIEGGCAQSNLPNALRFARGICGATTIIVDNSNTFLGGRNRDFRVDWGGTARSQISGDRLLESHFVVTVPPQHLSDKFRSQLAFYDWLERCGWHVHRHRLLYDLVGRPLENEKQVDGGVKALMLQAAHDSRCASIVLMTGDGGMTDSVKFARQAGKCVFVIAWSGTLHPALAHAATDYAYVDELRSLLARVAN